ncbi:MAG: glutamine amidotransferase [Phycisphaerales bacterium]|nr:glutamine amidotransferase [Phycisphaerales bacterium]
MASIFGGGGGGQDARVTFLSLLPREVFTLLFLIGAVLLWWMYRRVAGKVSPRARWTLLGLRIAFLAVLVFMLAAPAIETPRTRSGGLFTAVVVDASQSMSIDDVVFAHEKMPRIDAANRLLLGKQGAGGNEAAGLLEKLRNLSQVVVFSFDNDLHRLAPSPHNADIHATGPYTNIYRSLKQLDTELRGVQLASVVMLTDGNIRKAERGEGGGDATAGTADDAAEILKARGVPLHVIGLGNPHPQKDFEVVKVFAPRKVRRNSEVEIFATVRSTDFHEPFEVKVLRGDETIVSKTVQPIDGTDLQRISLKLTPDHDGVATYKVMIPPSPQETITANNSKEFTLEIRDDRLPVLYVEGSPRLEYRFLRRVMFSDPDFRVVGLLRLAKDRFYVQGANDSEQYLQKGFPDTADKLFAFQTVILGDIEASYFTPAQLDLLESFVRERGGGLLMLGGVNSFGLGKYAGTAVAKMLPLEITNYDPPYVNERYNAHITEEGRKHPVMRLSADAEANRHLWDAAPQLMGITPVKGAKLGGQVLLTDETTDQPVLAVANYGQGRVAAFTSGGSWYWRMSMPATDEFHGKFWKQLIRWLVVGAKEQLTLQTDQDVYAKREPVMITATVCGKDLKPLNNATVIATVTDPLGNKQDMSLDQVLSQEGTYQVKYVPEEEGSYAVALRVEGWPAEAGESKPPQTEFRVSEPLVEFNDAGLKEDVLKGMVHIAGGRYYTVDEADQLPNEVKNSLQATRLTGMETDRKPIWDSPWLFALLLAIGATEWSLRRKVGLA